MDMDQDVSSSNSPIAWLEKQLFCVFGQKCNPKHRITWFRVETSAINPSKDETMYSTILNAAQRCEEKIMLDRPHSLENGDSVAMQLDTTSKIIVTLTILVKGIGLWGKRNFALMISHINILSHNCSMSLKIICFSKIKYYLLHPYC